MKIWSKDSVDTWINLESDDTFGMLCFFLNPMISNVAEQIERTADNRTSLNVFFSNFYVFKQKIVKKVP